MAPTRIVSVKSELVRSTPERLAYERLAFVRSVSNSSAFLRFVENNLDFVRSAPERFAPIKSDLSKIEFLKFIFLKFFSEKSTSTPKIPSNFFPDLYSE